MSDIAALFEKPETALEIKGPDGAPFMGSDGEPWRITIAGPSHAQGFRAEEAMRLRVLRQMTDKDKAANPAEDYIERVLEPLVLRTIDWSPINQNGKPFLFTPENARLLYRTSDLVRKQVEGFVYRAENFRQTPSQS